MDRAKQQLESEKNSLLKLRKKWVLEATEKKDKVENALGELQ